MGEHAGSQGFSAKKHGAAAGRRRPFLDIYLINGGSLMEQMYIQPRYTGFTCADVTRILLQYLPGMGP